MVLGAAIFHDHVPSIVISSAKMQGVPPLQLRFSSALQTIWFKSGLIACWVYGTQVEVNVNSLCLFYRIPNL